MPLMSASSRTTKLDMLKLFVIEPPPPEPVEVGKTTIEKKQEVADEFGNKQEISEKQEQKILQ